MKRCLITSLCILVVGITITGCTNRTVKKETSVSVKAMETDVSSEPVKTSKTYYQQTDDDTISPLELELFDDGTFGFTHIYLSSYPISGTYEQSEDRMIAATKDEKYRLVFQVDGDRYIFLQEESSDHESIKESSGFVLEDGSVFAMKEPQQG